MAGLTVRARVYDSGKREIIIVDGAQAEEFAATNRRHARWINNPFPALVDWQVAEAGSLADVRSVLMSAFGIGWYNRARRRLAELEARPAGCEVSGRSVDPGVTEDPPQRTGDPACQTSPTRPT